MPLLIAVLLGLSGLLVVIYPLLGLDRESSDALARGPLGEVAERERSARDALREVEFDRRLGNLDDEDYQALRARYEERALIALKARYQREQELDAVIERQLDALRQGERTAESADGEVDTILPTAQKQKSSAAGSSRDSHAVTHNGARPASGTEARRRRGGRP
ncbi:MAG TPA: hypothetical protein VJR48_03795 [Ktedonobacterales bacterium]|nr:hypothetical protein [Ktedonobacterales bacterium]